MSNRRNGIGDYDFSGLPPRDHFTRRPSSSSGHRSSRRAAIGDYESSGLPPRERTRSHGPPISYYNGSQGSLHHRSSHSSSSGHRSSHSSGSSGLFRNLWTPGTPGPRGPSLDRGRRGAEDFSSTAADFYDPLMGQLRRRSSVHRASVQGDPELPPYRSASAYAREQMMEPPAYAHRGYERPSIHDPPPYRSFDAGRSGLHQEPMQYPPTRRPSHYEREERRPSMSQHGYHPPTGHRRGGVYEARDPPPQYFASKWSRYQ